MSETGAKSVVLVQADFHAECGIWIKGGCLCDPIKHFGISQELDAQMREWIYSYDAVIDDDAPFSFEEFSRRGRELAQELKRQLGDNYEVQYFDEAKNLKLPVGKHIWDIID